MTNIELREITGNIAIYPLIRTKEELFSTTVSNSYKQIVKDLAKNKLKADVFIINANWYDVSKSGILDAFNGKDPVPADETTNLGLIYKNGSITSGSSASRGYYISFIRNMLFKQNDITKAFKMGIGDPPGKPTAAFGDIGPLIINSLPFNSTNVYQKGTSSDAPLTGEPPIAYKKFLLKRSSKKFGESAQVDKESNYQYGKTCIGVSKSKVIIAVQKDGLKGASLAAIRDYFIKQGCVYGAFFDGSDSSMLFENGNFIINMGEDKNELCTAGILLIKYL